jgi:Icc-related predicted phosphoesterase
MKLLYTSDLLGIDGHYTRLIAVARRQRPDVVILGGNLLPEDSVLRPELMGKGQPQYVRLQFRKAMGALRDASGCREVLLVFGNRDWGSSARAMEELAADGLVRILGHRQALRLDAVAFLGYSCTPPTCGYVKDFERLDMPGDLPPLLGGARWDHRFNRPGTHSATVLFRAAPTMADDLGALAAPSEPWVFVAHAPPFQTSLDQGFDSQPRGSRAVRAVIEKYQPLLSLHGHVQESVRVSGADQQVIGRTVAVNPGQSPGRLHYAMIQVEAVRREVVSVQCGREA